MNGIWVPGLIAAIAAALVLAWVVWPRRPLAGPCRCGDDFKAHQHFRPGTECALCGCSKFRRGLRFPRRLGRLWALGLVDGALRLAEQDESSDENDPAQGDNR